MCIAATFVVALMTGCASGTDSTSSSRHGGSDQGSQQGSGGQQLIGPPPAREDLAEAEKRIGDAISSGDCNKINELNPVSIPQFDTPERCDYLKRLGDADPAGSESFKDAAGVVDYKTPTRRFSVVLLRDVDGLYHVLTIDPFLSSGTVGTPFADQFDSAAQQAFDALKTKDCNSYYEVVYRLTGVGSLDKKKVCPHVEQNPIASIVQNDQSAKPKPLGGNGYFAFYGVDTPQVFLTMVMVKESNSDRPSGLPKGVGVVPAGAAEYAYLGAYRTNQPNPPSD
jgi:hypothetical protein